MSIENNLKRIADALEELVKQGKAGFAERAVTTPAPIAPVAPPPTVVPVAPVVAPTPAAAPAPPVAIPDIATPSMTPEELNNALVVEFKRLGSRDAIDSAMAELGVTSVNDLAPDQYQVLLTKVQGIVQ